MKIVIWGYPLNSRTHSYIHSSFYKAFKHLGHDVYWFHDDEFDLVIRMRTDLEFHDRVPLEACKGNGLFMMNGSYQAGAGREYCDWFYCGPHKRVQQFDPLQVFDDFYADGIRHMHDLVIETLRTLQIPHAVLDLKAWMMDRSKIK